MASALEASADFARQVNKTADFARHVNLGIGQLARPKISDIGAAAAADTLSSFARLSAIDYGKLAGIEMPGAKLAEVVSGISGFAREALAPSTLLGARVLEASGAVSAIQQAAASTLATTLGADLARIAEERSALRSVVDSIVAMEPTISFPEISAAIELPELQLERAPLLPPLGPTPEVTAMIEIREETSEMRGHVATLAAIADRGLQHLATLEVTGAALQVQAKEFTDAFATARESADQTNRRLLWVTIGLFVLTAAIFLQWFFR